MLCRGVYPFERFTEAAKETLVQAQHEAERAHHGWVGTEHLLIALVSQRGTVAAETLARLGVDEQDIRRRVSAILGQVANVVIQRIVPTTRTATVIELSFGEARRAQSARVWTDHILRALLEEGQGIAAYVLVECGANLEVVGTISAAARADGSTKSANRTPAADISTLGL